MLKRILAAWWFWPVLLGLTIRLILMPITFHPDLLGHSFVAYFLAYEGVLNPYEHLLSLSPNHPLVANFGVSDVFIYPPLTYFTLGFFRILTKPFTDPQFVPYLWENLSLIFERADLGSHLFWYKFPYLFVDLGLGLIISSLFSDVIKKRLALILWVINPLTLYATFMMGQIDILPTFFTVLSLYFALNKKPELSMISLGIGGSYKMFPLLFLIPAACYLSNKFWSRVRLFVIGLLPFLLTIGPYLTSEAFRQMVLFTPKSQKMLFMIWKMTGSEGLYPFILILIIIYLYSYFAKKFFLSTAITAILLLTFSVTHYHPQWFLWVTPFIVIEAITNKFKNSIFYLIFFFSWLLIMLLFEGSLSVGLFSPINPQLASAVGLSGILGKYTDLFVLKNLIRSVFAGASIYYVYLLMTENKEKTNV